MTAQLGSVVEIPVVQIVSRILFTCHLPLFAGQVR
jgi:hypothetical protein